MKNLLVAIAGNPNCGKSTIFNKLTKSRQHVANYPGVTVEQKEGFLRGDDYNITFVDLPGIYSLDANSVDEVIAKNFILKNKPDIILNVVDASNLSRHLFLTTQLLELGIPVVIALNMSDIAASQGVKIDTNMLAQFLEVKLVAVVGSRGEGIEDLVKTLITVDKKSGATLRFDDDIEDEISYIQSLLPPNCQIQTSLSQTSLCQTGLSQTGLCQTGLCQTTRWLAIRLLLKDNEVEAIVSERITQESRLRADALEKKYEDTLSIVIAKKRQELILKICQKAIIAGDERKKTISDRLDNWFINKYLGIPIFLLFIFLTFKATFICGGFFTDLLQIMLNNSAIFFSSLIENIILKSLVVDGILNGVGSVILFAPNILFLFAFISLLEQSGYMARAAFIMDKVMHKVGLHGKSFIPMLIGFGCTVPAIMATRVLENRKDRLSVILSLPLIICSAKLVVFTIIIPAFFPLVWQPWILLFLYCLSFILAVVVIKLLRLTVFKGDNTPFIMELPPYHLPSIKGICLETLIMGWQYVKRAATIIFLFAIVLWFLSSFPRSPDKQNELSYSLVGRIGHVIEPVFKPLGFDWKIDTSLISGIGAREVFITQLSIIFSKEGKLSLREGLHEAYSPLQAFCIMLFMLISTPCVATIAITKKETNSWRWAILQLLGLLFLAYVITLAVYQIGLLLYA
jgi:ferrous iron transport protein B